jgi:hypothetical protein
MSCDARGAVFAALLVLAAPLAASAQAAAPEPSGVTALGSETQSQFAEAVKLYKDERFGEALPRFERLAADTDSPNARLYVGYCLVKLGRPVAAHRAFSRLLGWSNAPRDDKYDTTREAARTELFALEQRVAKVVLAPAETPAGLRVALDGVSVEPAVFGVLYAVEPGTHRIEAEAAGRTPFAQSIDIAAGETRTVALLLPKLEAPPAAPPPAAPAPRDAGGSTLRMLGFTSLGVGAAGLAVFAVAGLSAKSAHDDLEADCGSAGCSDASHLDDASRGKTLQTVANVGLAVGVLGTAGGIVMLLSGRPSAAEPGAAVSVGPRGGLLSYRGRF